jgi:hypothetical protein
LVFSIKCGRGNRHPDHPGRFRVPSQTRSSPGVSAIRMVCRSFEGLTTIRKRENRRRRRSPPNRFSNCRSRRQDFHFSTQ